MHILVTGGSGTVGWTILDRLAPDHDLYFTYLNNNVFHPFAGSHHLNIQKRNAVFEHISNLSPDVIVHSAAMTDVDACETNPQQAREINVEGTQHILDAAGTVGASVVFLSTSFVFDGRKEKFGVDDNPNPINIYGRTKFNAEKRVESSDVSTAILRTDQPYGAVKPWQSRTMVQWILNELSANKSTQIFDDWYNNPTYLPDVGDVCKKVIEDQHTGIFHVVGPDYINRLDWAKLIATEFGYDTSKIVPTQSKSANLPAERPNVNLDNTSVTVGLDISLTDVRSGAQKMAEN